MGHIFFFGLEIASHASYENEDVAYICKPVRHYSTVYAFPHYNGNMLASACQWVVCQTVCSLYLFLYCICVCAGIWQCQGHLT